MLPRARQRARALLLRGGGGRVRLLSAAADDDVTDATVGRVAALSHLHLERGTAEFDAARASLSAVLAWTRVVERVARAAEAGGAAPTTGGGEQRAAVAAATSSSAGAAADAGADAAFEALAELRFAELRRDAVTEGGDAPGLLRHAARTSEGHFSVPRVLGGE
jgi:Asp-tRNA(Asn)/Glu-tRNA(Gln) amidotransferase C subunit